MNKNRLIAALILAAIAILGFIVTMTLTRLLDMLPEPWCCISNGVMFFAILTAAIYGFITCDENDKKGGGKMTKYYFISYIHCDGGTMTYGHCGVMVNNTDLNGILRAIQRSRDFKNLPTILCLKDLSKREYKMLKGGSEHGED